MFYKDVLEGDSLLTSKPAAPKAETIDDPVQSFIRQGVFRKQVLEDEKYHFTEMCKEQQSAQAKLAVQMIKVEDEEEVSLSESDGETYGRLSRPESTVD